MGRNDSMEKDEHNVSHISFFPIFIEENIMLICCIARMALAIFPFFNRFVFTISNFIPFKQIYTTGTNRTDVQTEIWL